MKPTRQLTLMGGCLAALLAHPAQAQTTPATTTPPPAGETITLSPFEVTSARDVGYTATSSLAGGRLATDLKDTPVAISVLTREFLDDIAAGSFLEAAEWAPNTVSVYSYSPANQFNDYQTNSRSLGANFPARNYFIWYVNSDSYNTERIDIARGPNSIVFGDGGVGGVANVSTKRAYNGTLNEVQYRITDFGGKGRASIDLNRPINDKWSVRLNGLYDHQDSWEDRAKTDREGWFGTTTYQPFRSTQIRAEYEWGRVERVVANVPTDSISSWNGTTTVDVAQTAASTGSLGQGITRRTTDFFTFTPGAPDFGIVNWRYYGATTGNGRALDTFVPTHSSATFPTIPYYGYNFTAPNNYATGKYHSYAAFIEQRVGDNLFLEAAYNFQKQYRYVDQLVWEGVSVDVNRFVPQPTATDPARVVANPYFGQRYSEAGNTQTQMQGNEVEDFRLAAAYVLKTNLTEQRFLAAIGRRVDYFELRVDRMGRTDNPTVTDMFNAANQIRLRRYESELDKEWRAPAAGSMNGITTAWGTQNSSDQEQFLDYIQGAASGSWFKSRKLKTLLGVRRDTLDRRGNAGLVRGRNNEIIARGPLTRTLEKSVTTMTVGGVYQFNDVIGVFANYGESFEPAGTAFDINSQSLNPPESKGIDVGFRLSLLDNRISGSVAYYKNERQNVRSGGWSSQINAVWSSLNRTETITSGYSEVFDQRGDGYELDFTANLTPSWRMLFNVAIPETEQINGFESSLAYYNANLATWTRLRDEIPAGDPLRNTVTNNINAVTTLVNGVGPGKKLTSTFDYTANLFTNYTFRTGKLKNLQVGGGINARGKRVAAVGLNGPYDYLYANPYQLVTLTAAYRTKILGKDTRFQLNVSNVFDEQFKRYNSYGNFTLNGATSFERNRYILQAPRRFSLTTTVRF